MAHSMQTLLIDELREMLDAEKQASRAYPKFMKAVSSESFKEAIRQHSEETTEQVERLNRIFELLDMRSRGKTCEALRGLVEDAQELIDKDLSPELLDVALVAAAQKMEHFEIAAYGSARAHAEALDLDQAVQLLEESLEEEKAMDQRLNTLAVDEINPAALTAEEEGEPGEEAEETETADRAAAGDKPRRRRSR